MYDVYDFQDNGAVCENCWICEGWQEIKFTWIPGISGSGGGGLGKPVGDTDSIFNYIERFATVTDDITLDTSNAGVNTSIVVTTNPRIVVSDSKTVTVGAAKTLVVDILQIDSLFDA